MFFQHFSNKQFLKILWLISVACKKPPISLCTERCGKPFWKKDLGWLFSNCSQKSSQILFSSFCMPGPVLPAFTYFNLIYFSQLSQEVLLSLKLKELRFISELLDSCLVTLKFSNSSQSQKPQIIWVHLYTMSRQGQQSGFMLVWGCVCVCVRDEGGWGMSSVWWVWVPVSVSTLKLRELLTTESWILWYVDYTFLKLLESKKTKPSSIV